MLFRQQLKLTDRGRRIAWLVTAVLLLLAGSNQVGGLQNDVTGQAQTTRYVATTGNDQFGANTCTNSDAPCRTVTQAINVANAGDSIQVAAGAYTEAITIDKSLSLQGAGQAVTILQASTVAPGNPGEATERVITIAGQPEVQIAGFTIRHGRAPAFPNHRGGGLFNDGGLLTLTNVTFGHNSAGSGGGMHNRNSAPTLTNVIFSNNSADGGGGGMVNADNSTPVLTNVTFSDNAAGGTGGGMANGDSSPVLNGVIFSGNSADYGGGMANIEHSSPSLNNVTFSGNMATTAGGGMFNWNSGSQPATVPTLTDVTFNGNSAALGGGMANEERSPALNRVVFNGNSAGSGGGMHNFFSQPTLHDVTFSHNEAANSGGGMFNTFSSFPTLTNVTFSGNSATTTGGGMTNNDGSHATLVNVVFSGNATAWGGGMANNNSNPLLTNVTMSGNLANNQGGGIYNVNNSAPTLANAIIWHNQAAGSTTLPSASISNSNATPVISFSLIANSGGSSGWDVALGVDGGHNIDANPLFVDMPDPGAAPTGAGNLRLQAGSPAINAGDPDTDLSLFPGGSGNPVDLDGKPRVLDGRIDLGAYEHGHRLYLPLIVN
jgi:hypothetical protein